MSFSKKLIFLSLVLAVVLVLKPQLKEISAFAFEDKDYGSKSIALSINVLWEGRDLKPHNIEALKQFRETHPNIVFHHFIDPAYFFKFPQASETIKSVFSQGDFVGLYLNPWRSTVTKSGAIFEPPRLESGTARQGVIKTVAMMYPLQFTRITKLSKFLRLPLMLLKKMVFRRLRVLLSGSWFQTEQILEVAARYGGKIRFLGNFTRCALG